MAWRFRNIERGEHTPFSASECFRAMDVPSASNSIEDDVSDSE
jgi:hypothetical protein